jgi:hypothetical protein
MINLTYQLIERNFMKKILIGMIIFAGLITSSQAWAVSGNAVKGNNQLLNQVKEDTKAVKQQIVDQVKEKIVTRAGDLQLFKNKKVIINQGQLQSIDGTTLMVIKDNVTYKILTDDKTQLRRKFWGKSEISEFSSGDLLNVIGTWTDDTKTSVQAIMIKDTSIQMRHGVFFGTITSKTDNSFVMQTIARGNQSVTIAIDTKYLNRKQETINFSDISVGHKVRVRGLWNSLNSTITEVTQIKDFSLPVQSPKPSSS